MPIELVTANDYRTALDLIIDELEKMKLAADTGEEARPAGFAGDTDAIVIATEEGEPLESKYAAVASTVRNLGSTLAEFGAIDCSILGRDIP